MSLSLTEDIALQTLIPCPEDCDDLLPQAHTHPVKVDQLGDLRSRLQEARRNTSVEIPRLHCHETNSNISLTHSILAVQGQW